MTDQAAVSAVNGAVVSSIPAQTDNDEGLLAMWLHDRPASTRRAYEGDVRSFLAHAGKGIRLVTLPDVQAYSDTLASLATASKARKLSAVKSMLTFAHRVGYVVFNVGAPVRLPKIEVTLAERIMVESDVQKMLALETEPRNALLLLLLYGAGLRISEVCGLSWRNVIADRETGKLTVFGKGGKTRVVLLPVRLWTALVALRGDAGPDAPVFVSQRKGHLDPSAVHRVVKAAAARVEGLTSQVSAHWLRHAHASHALDRKAPIHLIQATLGHASVATTGRYLHAKPDDSSANYLAV